jgi:hypothetical protein
MRFITTKMHGIVDYIVGIILFFAPSLFGFADFGGAAVTIPQILGIAILIVTLLTRFEVGLIKLIPMKLHLAFDYLGSILLLTSPWLFGFSNLPSVAWVPHVIVGALILLQALMTETVPRSLGQAHTFRGAH